jgi:hypothetical protein
MSAVRYKRRERIFSFKLTEILQCTYLSQNIGTYNNLSFINTKNKVFGTNPSKPKPKWKLLNFSIQKLNIFFNFPFLTSYYDLYTPFNIGRCLYQLSCI